MTKFNRLNPQEQINLRLPGNGEKWLAGMLEAFAKLSPGVALMIPEIEKILRKSISRIYSDAHQEAYSLFATTLGDNLDAIERHKRTHKCVDSHFDRCVKPGRKFIEDSLIPFWEK